MLSIVHEISNHKQSLNQIIMSILPCNFETAMVTVIIAFIIIIVGYATSKYINHQRNYQHQKSMDNMINNIQNKPVPLKSKPLSSLNQNGSSKINKENIIGGIPEEINFTPRIPNGYNYRSSDQSQSNNNNNNIPFVPIIRRTKVTTKKIIGLSKEPITIEQTTTEHIDIPLIWSPFFQGLRFAVLEDQGKRKYMENSTNIVDMMMNNDNDKDNDSEKKYSFSLFDGHLGDEAAKFCTQHLHEYVAKFINDEINDDDDDDDNDDDDHIMSAIRKAFHFTDTTFKQYAFNNKCDAGAVGVYVYYESSSNALNNDYIYVANVGDCRAILCSKGNIKILTEEHNAKNESEKERCGDCIDGELLSGAISVTRAIGNYYKDNNHEKLDGLICDPHIIKHKLCKDDEFLIIACDGLWDVIDDKNAMTECRRSLRKYGDCNKAAQRLINLAKLSSVKSAESPLTSDNISVMVIGFADKDLKTGKEHIGPKIEALLRRPSRRRTFGRFNQKK